MSQHETNIVVCALIHRNGKIFVARRAATKAIFPGRFELPGGHVDLGENLKNALKRELREELQVEVNVGQAVDAFTYGDAENFECEVLYLCQIIDNSEPTLNPTDHSEALWLSEDEIAKFDNNNEETEALRRGFELLKEEAK
jgi:8-oxo-dGTP diphosphatase